MELSTVTLLRDNLGVRLGQHVSHLLTQLSEYSKSSVVVLRTISADIRKLELMAFAYGQDAPPIGSGMEIPLQKSFEAWGTDDPASAWGFGTLTEDDKACGNKTCGDYFSENEQDFIAWIRQKAWFPLESNGESLVLVLLRGDDRKYTRDEVISSWMYAQSIICHQSAVDSEKRFMSSLQATELVPTLAKSLPDAAQLVTHALASGRGMGWNRVWIFRADQQASADYRTCVAAIGELRKPDWGKSARRIAESSETLSDELSHALRSRSWKTDSMHATCLGSEPFQLHMDGEAVPLRLDFFADQLAAHVAANKSALDLGGTYYAVEASSTDEDFLVILNQAYDDVEPSLTLSTMFIQHAIRLISCFAVSETTRSCSTPSTFAAKSIEERLAAIATLED